MCFIDLLTLESEPVCEVCLVLKFNVLKMKKFASSILIFWLVAVLLGRLFQLNPNAIDLNAILSSPNLSYLLGADDLGRSILARLLRGVEVSFIVAIVVTAITMLIGVCVGLWAGFYGGKIDRVLMQITDVFLAFPGILLAIAFAAVLGPGLVNLMIALSITGWVSYARLTRGQALGLRNRQHVLAAESLGASVPRIIFRHILPLLTSILVVEATYSLASVMIAEASLSFLGLGIQAPNASWGAMLRDGVRYMLIAPHYVLIVGLSLMSLILAINLGGDYLRDKLDVRTESM
jgi:peptide/nickel transport system permease protein